MGFLNIMLNYKFAVLGKEESFGASGNGSCGQTNAHKERIFPDTLRKAPLRNTFRSIIGGGGAAF